MVKSNYKLVRDFILPRLENKTYGAYLTWEDRKIGSFKISRIHQNNEHFSQDCIEVYKDWSLRRNLWISKDPKNITKAKHRLVSALRRSPEIEVLDKESSYYRFRFKGSNSMCKDFSIGSTSRDETMTSRKTEDKGENENIVLHVDIHNNSENCLFKYGSKTPNRLGTNNKLAEELCRSTVIFKKSDETEIESIQNDEDNHNPLTDNLTSTEDNGVGSVLKNKCGCVILLDSNFLCNKCCIWHGNFS